MKAVQFILIHLSTGTHTQLPVLKVKRVPLGLPVMINGEMLELTSNFLVQCAESVIFGLYVRAQKPIHDS